MPTADYMRAYRARKKAEAAGLPTSARPRRAKPDALAQDRIAELEAEVKRLKQDLARRVPFRPTVIPITATEWQPAEYKIVKTVTQETAAGHQFGAPKPAPKPSRSSTSARGRAG